MQEVLNPLQKWLVMGRNWNFNRKPPSSSRRNSHLRKPRKVGAQTPPLLIFLLVSSVVYCHLLPFFVSLFGAEYSPALRPLSGSASPCHISNRPVSKYITPSVHPQHCSQLVSKSWAEPWHWYLFTVCHTVVIHPIFPHGTVLCLICYLHIPLWLPLALALQNQHGSDSSRCQMMKSNNKHGPADADDIAVTCAVWVKSHFSPFYTTWVRRECCSVIPSNRWKMYESGVGALLPSFKPAVDVA